MNSKNRLNLPIGVWIFLSVLLIVISSVGITLYNNSVAENRRQEAARIEDERKNREIQEQANIKALNDYDRQACLSSAYDDYDAAWKSEAAYLGTGGRLPSENANRHDNRYEDAKDECYLKYGH